MTFFSLQALHLHNNHLTDLPMELLSLRKLFILVLAFNRFDQLPSVVCKLTDVRVSEVQNIIMAGNVITSLSHVELDEMRYVKKVDFRMNKLTLRPDVTSRLGTLEHLTHLDVRDNAVRELDLRALRTLEYLNVERNRMEHLLVPGQSMKQLLAADNELSLLSVTPKPEWLVALDVSKCVA